ncbi:alkaline phosphatase family protein [Reyranella sp.]|uniref:alkaline phosphatase family protein n=1 Tax=Reyranella sp. TaxID=1929291 RepID=UPI003BAD6047
MAGSRRAVFVCCDGLGRNWVRPDTTPVLESLRRTSLWCDDHAAVFPSVTRVSAASVATGCLPARHGLHGNRMGLVEQGRIVVRDVGAPDFRAHMRRATGGTLRVPALAERVAEAGGFVAFSNVSPGAAYFLDPENFGHVYHRSGSFAPGGRPIAAPEALAVTHDAAGDWAMTQRFCDEVLDDGKPAVAFLWLCDPDHTLHGVPLGSPAHAEALAGAERCVAEVVRRVERLRAVGEEILLLVGSDHGQETIGEAVTIEDWLAEHGLAAEVAEGDVAVAGQGTAAVLYATPAGRDALLGVLDAMRREPWAAEVVVGDALATRGFAARDGVVAAVNMARRAEANPYGVPGRRWVAAEGGKPVPIGSGQHGGWGPDETQPFLMVNDGGRLAGHAPRATSLTDIAPTIARFLGLGVDGFDGAPLAGG